jgi:hypothetical protein
MPLLLQPKTRIEREIWRQSRRLLRTGPEPDMHVACRAARYSWLAVRSVIVSLWHRWIKPWRTVAPLPGGTVVKALRMLHFANITAIEKIESDGLGRCS